MELLTTKPRIINVGLQSFNESILQYGGKTEQFNWRPRANGNKKMIRILDALEEFDEKSQLKTKQ